MTQHQLPQYFNQLVTDRYGKNQCIAQPGVQQNITGTQQNRTNLKEQDNNRKPEMKVKTPKERVKRPMNAFMVCLFNML